MSMVEQEYPFVVNVDGVKCRVNVRLPEGVTRGIYEIYGTPGCYRFCKRCTDAVRPGSTRDMCLRAQQLAPVDRIDVCPESFVA